MTFLELSFSGAVFVLAIAAFRALTLRRLPKGTFVALWWLAAARLLLPVELSSRFSVYTLLEALRPKAAPVEPILPAAPVTPAALPVLIVPTQPAAAPMPQPAPAPFPVWTVLWISVGLLLAAWFLIRYVRWRRRFREALPADCPGLDAWFQLRRRVQVRVTDQITAPLTYGLFRPVILLPRTMDFADEEALTCVLAHERAHIRRLDGLLKLALTAAVCLHWFNPAVWVLYVLGNRDMELRCDEAAVLALGEDSRERYALALIRLAENRNVPLCGFAHRNGMEERIKAIMSIKKKSLLACFMALALVLGITTAFATSAKPAETDGPYSEDFTDRDLYAQSSAESAALWEETLAPYEPFGLTWTFDDPDLDGNGLTMTWEGHEVRGIYDEGKFSWITEHAGDGAFGPDAVELYTIYENGKLTGLRLATEEEQKAFDRDRRLSADSLKVETLADSVRYDSGHIYFTIPESEEPWSIFIQGRLLLEDGSGMSVHYLEEESEKAEWVPQMTYSFEVADVAYDELTMDVRYGNADYCYPLTLLLPEKAPLPVEPLPEGKADIPEGAEMIWPVESDQINNSFGDRAKPGGEGVVTHTGVDIGGMEKGTPVYAAGKGTVKEAGFNPQDGNFVRIDHGNGQETFYAHCEKLLVKTGDTVTLGQTIATVGSTGQSTGPHLHFEFRVNGVSQNPEAMLKSGQDTAKPEEKPEAEPEAPKVPEEELSKMAADPQEKEPHGLTLQKEQLVDGGYPTNRQGETYGNAFGSSLIGQDPDLIAAKGTNGESGYISTEDQNITVGKTPEEIMAYMNWKEENQVTGYIIPLYDQEHNVIGEFQVGEGGSGSKTFEEMKEAKAQGWPNSKGSTLEKEEPIFKDIDEARAAAEAGWVGDSNGGYYIPVGE
ncbi:M23/M56 family metallopeptidase [uncultured Oscillibacter sp.]|uniref:M23/M56 family metallopeptidase n=1 Tax=uncultured Oscillibacter sp. TaxID=876091 RepID=UPI0025EF2ED5|nr:M23/M56 family metallopeptidase [uncultured Oscillibacter sp.]